MSGTSTWLVVERWNGWVEVSALSNGLAQTPLK